MEDQNEKLDREYGEWMNKFIILEDDVDYSVFENQKPFLERLSQVSNSAVTVFDFITKGIIYASYNFEDLFGYDLKKLGEDAHRYLHSQIHPDDFIENRKNAISVMKFYYHLTPETRADYKFVYEYRVKGKSDQYVRVIVQYQSLELDKKGNTWLAIGVMDVSPDQSDFQGVKAQIINFKTGEIGKLEEDDKTIQKLSKREIEILSLVKDGYLSKEISAKLFISMHTVNTHRQRILEKFNANNSMEAVQFAAKLGLLGD
jgi:DNA-binding CsgD family transcriptional regulator